jgi:hypothetical protein
LRQHLLRSRLIEAEMRTELLRRNAESEPSPAQRVLLDLLDLRIRILDRLIDEQDVEAGLPFSQAMERLRLHFDQAENTPYRAWRGATPKDEPSLAKDIKIVFDELISRGIWGGPSPVLDSRWDPS